MRSIVATIVCTATLAAAQSFGVGSGSSTGSGSDGPRPPPPTTSCQSGTCDFAPGVKGPKTISGQVRGNSGIITFFRSNGEASARDKVDFRFEGAVERKANGDVITSRDAGRASNFAMSPFTSTKIGSSNATRIAVNVTTSFQAVYGAEVYFIESDGELQNAGETLMLKAGSAKVNVHVFTWPFQVDGEFVDVTFSLSAPPRNRNTQAADHEADENARGPPAPGQPRPARPPRQVEVDGGARMIMSTLVKVDGRWENMTNEFPRAREEGANLRVTVRLPRFTGSAFWDPSLEYSEDPVPSSAPVMSAPALSTLAAVALAVLVGSFAGREGSQ